MTRRRSRRASNKSLARQAREVGQAALGLVLLLILLLVTTGAILAANAVQHDPLVQNDVLEHYAYRALEAGINSYLNTINAQPNFVDCSSTSKSATCKNSINHITYDVWSQVPETTVSTTAVPEWYMWTNPQLCFSTQPVKYTACTTTDPAKSTNANFEYVREMVIGASGTPGHYKYQSSIANLEPTNSFLTHVWWSKYESAPNKANASNPTSCKWNYKNGYGGPGGGCDPAAFETGSVFFGPTTHVNGPVFSDDSIYVVVTATRGPTFGSATNPSPVTTVDPSCLFVAPVGTADSTAPRCKTLTKHIYDTATNSHYGATYQKPPTTDTLLQKIAAFDGCVYAGPTTISFYATTKTTPPTGYMNVTSPETTITSTTGRDANNTKKNTNNCPVTGSAPLPNATRGNGIIYVKSTSGACATSNANPFGGLRTGQSVTAAQIVQAGYYSGTNHGYNYTDDVVSGKTVNCEGEVFVRNADKVNTPAGKTAGLSGNLTIAATTNVVITGSVTYTSCGTGWNSQSSCPYHAGKTNDTLGLIANDYIEVNRPVKPNCRKFFTSRRGTTTYTCPATDSTGNGWSMATTCSTTVTDVQAALCDPGSTLKIDAAILDLSHEFTVDNYQAGSITNHLVIYGAIDQYWRGPVGIIGRSGYNKWYTWDSRLQYVSIPSFLTPGQPSWTLLSSSVVMTNTCPTWPKPYGTPGDIAKTKTKDPSTVAGAC